MPETTRKILVLFAHPATHKSRVNRVLAGAVRDLDGVTFHDLYEAYPDFHIDVEREQRLLMEHEVAIFHHPFFWYSTPAILKEWQDLVLEHGWAYGSKGDALRGKLMLSVITTGGRESAYRHDGHNRHTMAELLAPIRQTAQLCGMEYLPPFVVHGTHRMIRGEMDEHGADLVRLLEALRDDDVDLERAREVARLNADLDALLRG